MLTGRTRLVIQRVLIGFAEIWQECCPIMWQKIRVAEFFFVASFESNEYLRKATACFIKT